MTTALPSRCLPLLTEPGSERSIPAVERVHDGKLPSNTLERAMYLRDRFHFSVIVLDHPEAPINALSCATGKRPIERWKEFQQRLPTDEELISRLKDGLCRNIGIVCGAISRIVVVDADGEEALDWCRRDLSPTPMATKTSRGMHWYFRHPGDGEIPSSVRVRPAGSDKPLTLDIRGDGAYVVAPLSVHMSGAIYEQYGPWPDVDELPLFKREWFEIEAPRALAKPVVLDSQVPMDERRRRAAAYLHTVEPAVEGQGGDNHTYRVAALLLRDFGLGIDEALPLFRVWNQGCLPPWDDAQLVQKLRNAQRYGRHPIGALVAVDRAEAAARDADNVQDAGRAQPNRSGATPDGFEVATADGRVCLALTRLKREHGGWTGRLRVSHAGTSTSAARGAVVTASLRLHELADRARWARYLKMRLSLQGLGEQQLLEMLDELVEGALQAVEIGQPLLLLSDVDVPKEDDILDVGGFPLLRRQPSMLFGDGNSGKSLVALYLAGRLQRLGVNTLFMDWEQDQFDHGRRLRRMFGSNLPNLAYRRGEQPFAVEVDGLLTQVREHGIQYLVIDSVAFAADAAPESAEVAQRFFRALRTLGVGSLMVAHATKAGGAYPFGSVFWWNGCRSIWQVQKLGDGDEIQIALRDSKFNMGRRRGDRLFNVRFEDNSITFNTSRARSSSDSRRDQEAPRRRPLAEQARDVLAAGPMTMAELALALGADKNSIQKAISRAQGEFTTSRGSDGLTRVALGRGCVDENVNGGIAHGYDDAVVPRGRRRDSGHTRAPL